MGRTYSFVKKIETEGIPDKENKVQFYIGILYIRIFQKKIFYDMNIILAPNKIHKNSHKASSAIALIKIQ